MNPQMIGCPGSKDCCVAHRQLAAKDSSLSRALASNGLQGPVTHCKLTSGRIHMRRLLMC